MPIQITCECGNIVQADERDVGKPIRCGACKCWTMIPDPSQKQPSEPARAAEPPPFFVRPAPLPANATSSVLLAIVMLLAGAFWGMLALMMLFAVAADLVASAIGRSDVVGLAVGYSLLAAALISGTIGALCDKPWARPVLLGYIIGETCMIILGCVGVLRGQAGGGAMAFVYLLTLLCRIGVLTAAYTMRERLLERLRVSPPPLPQNTHV